MRKDVQWYSHTARELKFTQQNKIKKFLEAGCIEYDREKKCYICKPLEGYNKTTYTLIKEGEGFTCDCQCYVTGVKKREKDASAPDPSCSHVGALMEHFSLMHRRRREQNVRDGITRLFDYEVF